ncbi:MAG TPA: hypothetical protein DIU35_14455 [Candidatus Latescibacteria bacterium]|nr:hypothetical protein [Candidatus Latescibacterota bacterium]
MLQVIPSTRYTIGLDAVTSRNIVQLIRDCRDDKKTILFSTHRKGEVSLLSDDLAIIHKGSIRYCGAYDAFQSQMASSSLEDGFIRIVEGAPGTIRPSPSSRKRPSRPYATVKILRADSLDSRKVFVVKLAPKGIPSRTLSIDAENAHILKLRTAEIGPGGDQSLLQSVTKNTQM